MPLHNRVNNRELKQKLKSVSEARVTLSFYRYCTIEAPTAFRNTLYRDLSQQGVMGRIYVAGEGINAQVSIPETQFEAFQDYINSLPLLSGVRLNRAVDDDGKSFFKLKIQVRRKIVADGLNDDTFNAADGGTKLDAESFNRVASMPDALIVDMRNHYESEVGHFRDAICPDADTFRDALPIVEQMLKGHEEKPIIMYCTGGIRCEKASAWMKHRGFKAVYQLDGGIIEYTRQAREKNIENRFVGKNFVFDERMGERISEDVISVCHQCGKPCDNHTNCRNDGCHLLFIQCEECAMKYNGCCSAECMHVIRLPDEVQRQMRSGKAQGRKVFRKGRFSSLVSKPQS